MAKSVKAFKTEVQQLLNLVINSLYSKKEIFLRELISNASDAIDRVRFEALTDDSLLQGDSDFKIKIIPDKDRHTLTITDNGIGMNREEVENNIGTIANSGTRQFLERIQHAKDGDKLEFIGQFGVGFYSAFMVADRVELLTKRAGENQRAVKWESSGSGEYTIEDAEKESRGTVITLHLREGMDEYLDEWRVRSIITDYSDYISFPIVMDVTRREKEGDEEVEKTVEETLNSMKSIWKKAKDEISREEYNEFYKHISHDFSEPLKVIHYAAEGTTEFKALLFIPSQAPFDMMMPDMRKGIHLYVKNVFITDDCKELLPDYLRFIRGVVDSSDLPLNISREMFQDDAIIKRIHKSLVGKILNTLKEMMDKEREDYLKFYSAFGKIIKEGLYFDFENQDKLKELVLYQSTANEDGKLVSLREYVDRMPEKQKDIYYITGENLESVRNSPYLEIFKEKGYEVLFFTDQIDEFVIQRLFEYDKKKLVPVHRGELDLDTDEEKKEKEEKLKESQKEYEPLLKFIHKHLEEDVKEVKFSNRLTDSVCCLVAEDSMGAGMEKLLKAMNKDVPPSKRVLELNPGHPLLSRMKGYYDEDENSERLKDYIELIHDQALISAGSTPKNPTRFTKLISELMVNSD
ncbi:MAG: molecular chaperone HtpG [candidate division Zixibacteria bacterium]|nr:molecular chaperone HtpG [candidate division Zixibacteria bacterium]